MHVPVDEHVLSAPAGKSNAIAYGAIMTFRTPRPLSPDTALDRKLDGKPVFAPYDPPAGGWGALRACRRLGSVARHCASAAGTERRAQRLQSTAVDEPAAWL